MGSRSGRYRARWAAAGSEAAPGRDRPGHRDGLRAAWRAIGEAFVRLRAYAYAQDRRLSDVARDIVARRLRLSPDGDLPQDGKR